MGLLDRALTLGSEKEVYSPSIEPLVKYLENVSTGLDFPSRLFTGIAAELKISKGALLLPEGTEMFVPWSVIGLDETTARRIRIPDSLIESLKNSSDFTYLELNNSEVNQLKDYFSFREYSVTDSLLISPIKNNDTIVGLLLVSDGELIEQVTNIKKDILNRLSRSVGPLLLSKRQNIVSKFESQQSSSDDLPAAINKYIEKVKDTSFLIISVNVENYIKFIEGNEPGSIRFRILEDILRLVKTMIGDKGYIINRGSGSFLILQEGDRETQAELLVHQIGISLGYFFKIDTTGLQPGFSFLLYPRDGRTAEELIRQL